MQHLRCRFPLYLVGRIPFVLILMVSPSLAQETPSVPDGYQDYFAHFVDDQSVTEAALHPIGLNRDGVGRSFALIVGVSKYPNLTGLERVLEPAAEDVDALQAYLKSHEFFDEIVVLENEHVTTETLEYFLREYFPARLKRFPGSRFLVAYSGYGMNDGDEGYLLMNTAPTPTDKQNAIRLGDLRKWGEKIGDARHRVLVLVNACNSSTLVPETVVVGEPSILPEHPGAHAITAGGSGELTWHDPELGPGSVFFEKVLEGLGAPADADGNGAVTSHELAAYLAGAVRFSEDPNQQVQFGDLASEESRGAFFFFNRSLQVAQGVLPSWTPLHRDSSLIQAEKEHRTALSYYRAGDYRAALPAFRRAVEGGVAHAANYVAGIYADGEVVERDAAEALRWYRRGAQAGDPSAMYHVGRMYQHGLGVARDYAEALRWYRNSADLGVTSAMLSLGTLYRSGFGVGQDDAEAFHWYRKSAEAGNAMAMYQSGWMYQNGRGVNQSYKEARRWHNRAAKAGNTTAMLALGWLYEKGMGVRRNATEARRWYVQALQWNLERANNGNTSAMLFLGWMYRYGRGGTRDVNEALRWYQKAAESGNVSAMNSMGEMYERGLGITQDYSTAVHWYQQGAHAGNSRAMENLGRLYLDVLEDYAEALVWNRKAAEAKVAAAMRRLGWMYEHGLGVPTDNEQAQSWYRHAVGRGDEFARERLRALDKQ